jgi:hypothetical protein
VVDPALGQGEAEGEVLQVDGVAIMTASETPFILSATGVSSDTSSKRPAKLSSGCTQTCTSSAYGRSPSVSQGPQSLRSN